MIRYHICGLCYDENDHIKDGEMYIDDFDTYEEAYEKFVKLQCQGTNWVLRDFRAYTKCLFSWKSAKKLTMKLIASM